MSESENFLRRWSRRKREAAEQAPDPRPLGDAIADVDPDGRATIEDRAVPHDMARAAPQDLARADERSNAPASDHDHNRDAAEASEFDLSQLPSIESITATTDVRPFLARGVPENLRRAALRRAWSADPAIRDFIGLAENQWDFAAENGVPGFGPLLQSDDVQQLVARVFGTITPDGETSSIEAADAHALERANVARTEQTGAQLPNKQREARTTRGERAGAAEDAIASDGPPAEDERVGGDFAAPQNPDAVGVEGEPDSAQQSSENRPPRRSHGGALPT